MANEANPYDQPDRLRAIFNEAISRASPEERQRYVAEVCGSEPNLRREVESLLRAHDQADQFLDQSVTGATLDPIAEDPGTIIGRYRLLEELGQGGFGVVYRAEQLEPVRREVALKIIKEGMDTQEVIARFEAERQALALMDHPNIAHVYDAGATATGRPYFVMELVGGLPVTEYCDAHRLSTGARLTLFLQVCAAVQHAHQKGIIHRDLKPSNVVVTEIEGQPVPKVIDFGIAKAIAPLAGLTPRNLITVRALLLGTPAYMSPEQLAAGGVDIDTRSDVYSLGVLLYELLVGTTPFDTQALGQAALDEVRRVIRETEPPKPSTRLQTLGRQATEIAERRNVEVGTLRRLIRGDLDWVVMKALEKDRGRRYETVNALARDLQHHLHHEPVLAGPPGAAYRMGKFVRRHRMGVAAVVAISAALVLGSVVSLVGLAHARAERDRAMAADKQAEAEKAVAAAVNAFLLEDLLGQAAPEAEPDREVKLRTLLDRAAVRVESRFEGQPLIEAPVREKLGSVYMSLGEYTNARPHFERALEIYTEHYGPEDPRTLKTHRHIIRLMRAMGEHDTGERLAEELVALQRRLLGLEHPETLESLYLLAAYRDEQAKLPEAEELMREVLAVRRRVLGPDHPDTVQAMQGLAVIFMSQAQSSEPGKMTEARRLFEEVLPLRRRNLGPEHPDTLATMNSLGGVYASLGDTPAAHKLFTEVLEIQSRVMGPEHPQTLGTVYNLALAEQFQGNLQHARQRYLDLIALRREIFGPEDRPTYQIKLNLGVVLTAQGELQEAGRFLDQAFDGYRRALGPASPAAFRAILGQARLGKAYLDQGQPAEAQSIFETVLSAMADVVPDHHPDALHARLNLADALAAQGRRASANRVYNELLAASADHRTPASAESSEVLGISSPVARALRALRAPGEALDIYRHQLAAETRDLGRGHPFTQNTLRNLAVTCIEAGRLDEARERFGALLTLETHTKGPTSAETLHTTQILAFLDTTIGHWSEAMNHCRTLLTADTAQLRAVRHYALLALLTGQPELCRDQASLLLTRAAAVTNDLRTARSAVQTCLTLAEHAADITAVLQLAARVAYPQPPSANLPADPDLQLLQGLTEYRAGRHTEAVAALRSLTFAAGARGLLALYLTALANSELGRVEEARLRFAQANRRLEEQLHTGALSGTGNFSEEIIDMCEVFVLRSEAERALFGRPVALHPDPEHLAAARQAWLPVVHWLHRARRSCLEQRWRDALDALDQASQSPAFNWSAARIELPEAEVWLGIALLRAGDLQRHQQLCRALAAAAFAGASSLNAAATAARICLLPVDPGPELLRLAGDLVSGIQAEFADLDQPRREDLQLIQGWLAYRTSRYHDAASILAEVSNSDAPNRRAFAEVLHSMTVHQLGQPGLAEMLLHDGQSGDVDATEWCACPECFPTHQILSLLWEEAHQLMHTPIMH
jgi:eukaryotic-like serine/threonine-protein kinase